MNWRTIDFQGIVDLDHKIVGQLEQFLQEKENRLAHQILNVIPSEEEAPNPTLPIAGTSIKLAEAVEGFNKKVRAIVKSQLNQQTRIKVDQVVRELNAIFWELTEVLEGCVVELFQQVRQVPIDRWHVSIANVVHDVKDVLVHYIEDLIWIIRRLEKPLKEFCQKFDLKSSQNWRDWFSFKKNEIDPHLLHNLHQTEKVLKNQYESFQRQYNDYLSLSMKAEEHLQNMKSYPIFAILKLSDQNLYIDIYRLLKMIELNRYPKKAVAVDTTKALKYLTSVDQVLYVFRTYYFELKDALFNSSLEWKSLDRDGQDFQDSLDKLKLKVRVYQQELRELAHIMSRYRTFILKNDPNPYTRSRWGFTEWIVGPEPVEAKKLLNMIYSAEELDGYFTQFNAVLERDFITQQIVEYRAHQEIEKLLHEMGQPLMSRSVMQNRAKLFLDELKACDEVGSPHMSTILFVEEVLSKVMREDWRYHVLQEFPLFHQLYRLHQGLVEQFDDPGHAFRVERLLLLFDQIKEWVEKEDVYAHAHEIELDMNDMKTYLQDFLATVQRALREKSHDPFLDETLYKLRHQLLEYRYLFGKFFLEIMSRNSDGMQLRNQFLFVDQYFESVENLLNELKMSWEGKR